MRYILSVRVFAGLICFSATLPAHAQTPAPLSASPPPGVRSLYAHQGDNSIITEATPEGYAHIRTLVRQLDGELDIIRTDVTLVTLLPADLKTLNISGPVSDTALLAAFHAGHLPAADHVRLTTREDTPIDTWLRTSGNILPLSLVPREDSSGTLSVELLQPSVLSQTLASDGTIIARLPDTPGSTRRLLFIMPTLLSSKFSAAR